MNTGYVKLYRKSIEGGWLSNHKLWSFWCWCLVKASYKKHSLVIGCQQVNLMPGDFIFGRKKASKELKISEQSIRTFVEFLKTSQNITIKTTNKYSIISIVNWDTYQNEETSTNQQINQQLTNNQPTTNHKQERKKEKKEKNKYMDCVFLSADEEQSLRTKLLNGDFEKAIEVLNNYKMQSGKKYASDYHAMQNWVIKRIQEDGNKVSQALLSGFDDL